MNEGKLKDGIVALWPPVKLGKIYTYFSDMPGQFTRQDEIPARASLPLIVTSGIIFHTYYDHFYYTFSHSLHVLQVNDFNKRVGSKRAP